MATKGNIGLYERYEEAWRRINTGIENGHYFEAIAIEESILSNRLTAFLYGVGKVTAEEAEGKKENGKAVFLSFAEVIKRWGAALKSDVRWEHPGDLVRAVYEWRDRRNKAIHALTTSFPGKAPKLNLEAFLEQAMKTAVEGAALAKKVTNWQKRQLTRAKKLGLVPRTK